MDETVQFFKEIFRDGEGRAVIVLPNFLGKPTNDKWFSYPEQVEEMAEYAEKNRKGSVWYSPILFKSDSRTKENALAVSVVAADADSCDPNNFRVRPTHIVQTSNDRWHVYWALNEAVHPHDVSRLNRRIAQVHKDDGCDTAFVNSAKLLRVPGTSNHKHPGAIVILADRDDDVFAFEDLVNKYPESEVPDALDVVNVEMPDDVEAYTLDPKNRTELMKGLPNSIGLRELMFGKYQEDKRSDVRFKLLCELYRIGLDDKAVMAIAWGAPTNKYTQDNRGVGGLWAEAMKAKAEVSAERGQYDEFDVPLDSQVGNDGSILGLGTGKKSERPKTTFLSGDERELLQVTFVDEWVEWAGTRTDSPKEFHRAAAITLLSVVYSEFGHAVPKFGKLKLNLWFMVLGRSTKDRKSTSRQFMNRALRALKTDDYNYILGDDVTPSGISLALHDRANKSSLFDRDETQGLFKELLNQSYMSGGTEVFTKLYDGWSGGRVRASGDKKIQESVPVSFLMFLMGILTETADVLTVTNYRSGFLTRFLYVFGSRPDGYKAPPLEQASEHEEEDKDEVFLSLVNHLAINRNYWEMLGGEGNTVPIRADADAWQRFQQFIEDVDARASATTYAEIIGTTTERMTISVLKLAALFAMDDRSDKIKMVHMLQAISYAGEWYDNAVLMASMVSASEWERDVDKLEQYINSKGGKVGYPTAYRAFKEKRPFEFEEMLSALEQRGILTRVQNGNRWMLEISYEE